MPATIVVGLQFGDEGKGKVSSQLMTTHDVCVRYSGGPNTGASVWIGDKLYKFHHLPVGIIHEKLCYMGSQMYIDPEILLEEIKAYKQLGFDVENLLKISADANIITASHKELDAQRENSGSGVGSTKRGMSPAAEAKYSRRAIKAITVPALKPYICDISAEINQHLQNGQKVLFEGSQGALLDIDHGFYPYISTTSNVAAAACVSCGFGPGHVTSVVGVLKPYMTKVGDGPFPTEMVGEEETTAKRIRERGGEYGTTTGRPRRVGWLDLPLLAHAARVNGCTDLFVTKCDVLLPEETIKVCVAHKSVEGEPRFLSNLMDKDSIKEFKPFYSEVNFEELLAYVQHFAKASIMATGWSKKQVRL